MDGYESPPLYNVSAATCIYHRWKARTGKKVDEKRSFSMYNDSGEPDAKTTVAVGAVDSCAGVSPD